MKNDKLTKTLLNMFTKRKQFKKLYIKKNLN